MAADGCKVCHQDGRPHLLDGPRQDPGRAPRMSSTCGRSLDGATAGTPPQPRPRAPVPGALLPQPADLRLAGPKHRCSVVTKSQKPKARSKGQETHRAEEPGAGELRVEARD